MQYSLCNKDISTILVGMKSVEQVDIVFYFIVYLKYSSELVNSDVG